MSDETFDTSGVDQERGHTFDGISEFDNRLPNWWLWSFYLTCIFSVLYWFAFHTTGMADLPGERFEKAMAAAADAEAAAFLLTEVTDEGLRELSGNPDVVARGKKLWVNCVVCHTESGGGLVGPNLTDKYWIHGGRPTDIYKTVIEGVIEKGMTAWLAPLGEAGCQAVVAYVLTLRNTNVEGGKAPEGEPYEGQ